jgi:hypothetical protein
MLLSLYHSLTHSPIPQLHYHYRHFFSTSKLWPTFVGLYDRSGERWTGPRDHAMKKKESKKIEQLKNEERVSEGVGEEGVKSEEMDSLHKAYFPILIWPEQIR